MGFKLAKRDETDVERMPSKRPWRSILDVRAEIGMLKRDMVAAKGLCDCVVG